MLNNQTRIQELTVEELAIIIREVLRDELRRYEKPAALSQQMLLELEPLRVGGWPEGLQLLGREDYYDEER